MDDEAKDENKGEKKKEDSIYIIPNEPGLARNFKAICKLKNVSQRDVVEGFIQSFVSENSNLADAALELNGGKVN